MKSSSKGFLRVGIGGLGVGAAAMIGGGDPPQGQDRCGRRPAARGQGEYLLSLGTVLGVKPDDQPKFVAFTQAHYSILFPSDRTSPSETLAVLTREWPASRR